MPEENASWTEGLLLDSDGQSLKRFEETLQTSIRLFRLWWKGLGVHHSPIPNSDEVKELISVTERELKSSPFPGTYTLVEQCIKLLFRNVRFDKNNMMNVHPTPLLPSVVASVFTMLQNPNNLSSATSPATTVMEEDCDGLCWQHLIAEEKLRPDAVVVTEPTNLRLYRGHRGRMEMRVEVKGRSCHSSTPESGENAIYKLSRIALEIEKLNTRLLPNGALGKGSISVTEAGSSSPSFCAVPDGANLRIDRRLTGGETKETAVTEVYEAARSAGYDDVKVDVLTFEEPAYTGKVYPAEKYYPTWSLDEGSPFLRAAVDVYAGIFGKSPSVGMWGFSSNAVSIAGMHGIPCLLFGPGNELLAHTANEACEIGQVTDAAAFYASLVAKLSGG